MQILRTLKEEAIERLAATRGEALDISANLNSPGQFGLILESHAHSHLGSSYVMDRRDLYMRLTNSYRGRFRSDIVEIGKSPEFQSAGGSPMIISDRDA